MDVKTCLGLGYLCGTNNFLNDCETVVDGYNFRPPNTTQTVENMTKDSINSDRHLTVRMISWHTNLYIKEDDQSNLLMWALWILRKKFISWPPTACWLVLCWLFDALSLKHFMSSQFSVNKYLAKEIIPMELKSLYSNHLSPCDYFLSPKL